MPNIIYFAQLSIQPDAIALQKEVLSCISSDWVDHVNRVCYSGSWDVLPIRTLATNVDKHPILQSFNLEQKGDWVYLPIINVLPQIRRIIDWFQCDVEATRLMRLKPGAHIKPHQDKGLSMENGFARFHVPICAVEQVEFIVNGALVPMQNGELWYLNADATHSVKHMGNEDRINLVIDCKVNEWLKNQIIAAVA
ncbi:MAG: hypothetical protein ACI9ES_002469 [Oceanospirillaceae bacterium]|jgi:hypothetical protein